MRIGFSTPISVKLLAESLQVDAASLPGGFVYPQAAYYVKALLKKGIKVSVFTVAPDLQQPLELHTDSLSLYAGAMRPRTFQRMPDCYAKERNYLRDAMRRAKCDGYHANWTYEFADATLAVAPNALVSARDCPLTILKQTRNYYRLYRYFYSRRVIPQITKMTVPSPYLKEKLSALGWYQGSEIEVIPNGVSAHYLESPLLFSGESPRFVSIGDWNPRKNFKNLLRAFARVRMQMPKVSLDLIGYGLGAEGPANQWAGSKALDAGVNFVGTMPHDAMMDALPRYSCLVAASLEESFGSTLIEATIAGLPVIGGQASGAVPWILGDGKCGLLCDVKDPVQLADAMLRVHREPQEAVERTQRAQARVGEVFSFDAVADKYIDIYQQMILC